MRSGLVLLSLSLCPSVFVIKSWAFRSRTLSYLAPASEGRRALVYSQQLARVLGMTLIKRQGSKQDQYSKDRLVFVQEASSGPSGAVLRCEMLSCKVSLKRRRKNNHHQYEQSTCYPHLYIHICNWFSFRTTYLHSVNLAKWFNVIWEPDRFTQCARQHDKLSAVSTV